MSTKTAVVIGVGAERGLGATLCRRFGKSGLHVIVAGRTKAKTEVVAETIREQGGAATAMAADATVETEVMELFRRAEEIGAFEFAAIQSTNEVPVMLPAGLLALLGAVGGLALRQRPTG